MKRASYERLQWLKKIGQQIDHYEHIGWCGKTGLARKEEYPLWGGMVRIEDKWNRRRRV